MKACASQIKLFVTALGLLWSATSSPAQGYMELHSFSLGTGFPPANLDGAVPLSGVVVSGNVIYGTASQGTNGAGSVYRVNIDGTGFTNIHNFSVPSLPQLGGTNTDGGAPHDRLVLSGNVLYGTTYQYGYYAYGTVFRVNIDGTGFTTLHNFGLSDGGNPSGGLAIYSNMLFGTTTFGGLGFGTIFRINTNGSGFANLYTFGAVPDGDSPESGLVLSGTNLYGMTAGGGTNGAMGVIYSISVHGSFHKLFDFGETYGRYSTNITGATPYGGLAVSGNTLYGVTKGGGRSGEGVVFSIGANGSSYTVLHTFSPGGYDEVPNKNQYTNSDGTGPLCDLFLSGTNLYGTTQVGGANAWGTIFAISTNGVFETLYDFRSILNNDIEYGGADPYCGVTLAGNTLYGTTELGGQYAQGNVFSFALPGAAPSPVPVSFQATNGTLVLSWSSTAFTLQSTPSLTMSFSNVVGATSPYTVPATNAHQFYRLKAN